MEMEIIILIIALLLSAIAGMIGYWLKSTHRELKRLILRLTASVNHLERAVATIQTQIDKGIETDITEIKTEVNKLKGRSNKHQEQISLLNQKILN